MSPQIPPSKIALEAGRLDTYDPSWPHSGKCSKEIMAQAGYFYCGQEDMVQCFCCLIKLQGWDPEIDEPWQKHIESCLFGLKGKKEGDLTVDEFIDVLSNKAIHQLDHKFSKVNKVGK